MQKQPSGILSSIGLAGAGFFALAADARAESLPQLDFSKYPPQLIWLGLTFVALYLLMSRVALPRVGEVLEERRDRIADNLDRAEALRIEAQTAEQTYREALAKARADAAEAVKGVRDAAQAKAAARQTELGERLTSRIQEAEAAILDAKGKAIAEMRATATEAARAAAEKLTGERMDDSAVSAAVTRALEGNRR